MFSAMFSAPAPRARQFAGAYQQVAVQTGVEAASPHQLVALLFDGFFTAVHRARGAMRSTDVQGKGRAIGQALSIVDEGLKGGLDLKAGGQIAADLSALYSYVSLRLAQANLRNDEAALDECLRLMTPLQEAWTAIGPAANAGR
jgi:flagellar protein FliS